MGLKQFRPILENAKARDVSEADTVTIVTDVLGAIFGFDKYSEITGEYAIRGTYCDLAIRMDNVVTRLIEVKAIGSDLKEGHLRQAIQYGASEGIEWVILTNGICWQVHHILFQKPITTDLVFEVDLLTVDLKRKDELERLFLLTRESVSKNTLKEYKARQEAVNRYMIAGLLFHSSAVESAVKRELYRTTGVRVESEELQRIMRDEVVKRDVSECEQAKHAARVINRAEDKKLRTVQKSAPASTSAAATEQQEA